MTTDAEKICKHNKADIESLIDHLQDLIAGNPGTGHDDAADLGYVRKLLIDAVAHFGGLNESDILATLEELRG